MGEFVTWGKMREGGGQSGVVVEVVVEEKMRAEARPLWEQTRYRL